MIVDSQPDMTVVGEVDNGRAAVELATRIRPDVCLLDIRMPVLDGLAATRLLAGPDVQHPLRVVIATTFDSDEHVQIALRNGAAGFILKDSGPHLLLEAVRAAAAGDALISPSITVRYLDRFIRPTSHLATRSPPLRTRARSRPRRRPRPRQPRDRHRAVHLPVNREDPPHQHPNQTPPPQPGPDRDLGNRTPPPQQAIGARLATVDAARCHLRRTTATSASTASRQRSKSVILSCRSAMTALPGRRRSPALLARPAAGASAPRRGQRFDNEEQAQRAAGSLALGRSADLEPAGWPADDDRTADVSVSSVAASCPT